jgi:hypothetical protein
VRFIAGRAEALKPMRIYQALGGIGDHFGATDRGHPAA